MNEGSAIIAMDGACDEHTAAELEDDIVDEAVDNIQVKNHAGSKYRKITTPVQSSPHCRLRGRKA